MSNGSEPRNSGAFQRHQAMGQASRDRVAVEEVTRKYKDHTEKMGGQITEDAARRKAAQIMERVDRKR